MLKIYKREDWNTIQLGLSARDYKLHQLIGELIDNSISNPYEGEKVKVNVVIDKDHILIEDEGSGQDSEGLAKSWGLGKLSDGKTSKYGIGMKQAATAGGNIVITESKKRGEREFHRFTLNKREIAAKPKLLSDDDIGIESFPSDDTNSHFFRVIIKELEVSNQIISDAKSKLGQKLGNLYCKLIESGQVEITINKKKVKAPGPVPLVELPNYENATKVFFENKELGVNGWWGITMKHEKHRTEIFGMTTYYDGRVVTQGDIDIIGVPNKRPDYYRLEGEVHFNKPSVFDDNITSSKNSWIQNNNYEKVVTYLKETVDKPYNTELIAVRTSSTSKTMLKRDKIAGDLLPRYLAPIFPELRKDSKEIGKRRARSGEIPEGKDVFIIEKRAEPNEETTEEKERTAFDDKRKPKTTHTERRPSMRASLLIDDIEYKIRIQREYDWNEKDPRYTCILDNPTKTLILSINMNNHFIAEEEEDVLLKSALEWIVEGLLVIDGNTETKEFLLEREAKLSGVDYIEWLNNIDKYMSAGLTPEETTG